MDGKTREDREVHFFQIGNLQFLLYSLTCLAISAAGETVSHHSSAAFTTGAGSNAFTVVHRGTEIHEFYMVLPTAIEWG